MADKRKQTESRQMSKSWSVLLTVVGTVLGLASFFTILGLMLANLHESQPQLSEGEPLPAERLLQLRAEDERRLTTYEPIDQDKGVWRIPMDVAIDKMIAERQRQRSEE